MKARVVYISLLFLLVLLKVSGQTSLYNKNTALKIDENATLYISGDYVDSTESDQVMFVYLQGQMVVGGDFLNYGNTVVIDSTAGGVNGSVLMTNTKEIGGETGIHVPNLETGASSTLTLKTDLEITESVNLGGSMILDDVEILWGASDANAILNESSDNNISGEGTIYFGTYNVTDNIDISNFKGTGIGFNLAGSAINTLDISRYHTSSASFTVAGGSPIIDRYYTLYSTATNNDTLPISRLDFTFYDVDRPAEYSAYDMDQFAMYVMIDSAANEEWIRLGTTSGTTSLSTGSFGFEANRNYTFVVSKECDLSSKPDAVPTVTGGEVSAVDGTISVCEGGEVTVISDAHYSEWITNEGTFSSYDSDNSLTIESTTLSDDGTIYTLYERKQDGCENTIAYTLEVIPNPTAVIDNPGIICDEDNVTFKGENSLTHDADQTITSYDWDFGDTDSGDNTATGSTAEHIYSGPGQYTTTLTVENSFGCTHETLRNVTINNLPVVTFEIPDSVCQGSPLSPINDSYVTDIQLGTQKNVNTLNYKWGFQENDSSDQRLPSFTYSTYGEKIVYLQVSDTLGCTSDSSETITINPLPLTSFIFKVGEDTIVGTYDGVCQGTPLTFQNTSTVPLGTIDFDAWNFGNGVESSEDSPERPYTVENTYNVTLTQTTNHGCVADSTGPIIIHPVPDGSILYIYDASNTLVNDACINEPLDFESDMSIPAGYTYTTQWTFGDGESSALEEPTHSYDGASNYNVSVTATSDKGCIHTIENDENFTVHADPVAGFNFDETCEGNEMQFYGDDQDVDGPITYAWTFDQGGTNTAATGQEPTHEFPGSSSYNVKLVVTSGAECTDEVIESVEVKRVPNLVLKDQIISVTGSVTYNPVTVSTYPQPTEGTYQWTLNGAEESSGPALSVSQSGNYQLNVTTNDGSCEFEENVLVLIVEPSDLPSEVRSCSEVTIDATPLRYPTTGTLSYAWTLGGMAYSSASTIVPDQSGEYVVQITYANGGESLSYSETVEVALDTPPVLNLGEDQIICAGESATLESNVPGDSLFWYNSTGVVVSTSQTYVTSTPDTYQLVVYQSTCSSDTTITVSTIEFPEAGFNASATVACEGEDVTFESVVQAAAGDAISTYSWDFDDGNSSTEQNPVKSFANSETYSVTLTVTSLVGCTDDFTMDITVKPKPVIDFSVTDFCQGQDINLLNNTTISDASEITYLWDFGDTSPSSEEEPKKSYSSADDYTIALTATAQGCVVTESMDVTISPKPTGAFRIVDESANNLSRACVGQEVYFENNTSDPDDHTIDYSWNFGDGTPIDDQEEPSHTFSTSGVYTVILELTTQSGCVYSIPRNVTIDPLVQSDFSFENVCGGENVTFTNASTISNGTAISYEWDFGDGTGSEKPNLTHEYSSYGDYEVTLTATSNKGCETTISKTVLVYQKPDFDLGDYALSVDGSYLLDPTSDADHYLPAGSTYSWLRGNTEVSTASTYEATETGTYFVTVETPNPESCLFTTSVPVYVLTPGDLGADLTVCSKHELLATPISYPSQLASVSYEWFKDSVALSHYEKNLLVTESGKYQVEVTFTIDQEDGDPSVSYSDEIEVTVEDPTAGLDLGGTTDLCVGGSITLSSNVVADSYQWRNVTEGVDLGSLSSQLVDEPGTYELTIESGICSRSETVEVVEVSTPVAGFTSTATSCVNSPVSFQNISFSDDTGNQIVSQTWDFGDGSSSTLESPDKAFAVSGTYEVTLNIATDNGCTNSFSKEVTVVDAPTASFAFADVCFGETVSFTDNSTVSGTTSYLWDFGDGNTSVATNPSHTYSSAGVYDVTLTLDNSCESTFTDEVEVFTNPTIFTGSEIVNCGSSIELDAGPGMTRYRWYDVSTDNTLSTLQTYTVSSDGEVGIEVTSVNGCEHSEEVNVTLNTLIQANLGNDRTVCDRTILNPGAFPGATFTWSTGATTPTIEVAVSGTYSVDISTPNGCSSTDEVVIAVEESPSIDLGSDQTICFGEAVTLDAGNLGATYNWSTGESTQTIEVTATGQYAVEVTKGSCSVQDTIQITVIDIPSIDFEFSNSCIDLSTNFNYTGASSGLQFLWEFGDGTQSVQSSPGKVFSSAGDFDVTLTVTNAEGCDASMTKQVEILPPIQTDFDFEDVCVESERLFTNQTTYSGPDELSYIWTFDHGETSTDSNPTHTYNEAGTFSVRLQATNENLCTTSTSKSINVLGKPSISLNDVVSCESVVTLDAGNSESSFLWSDSSTDQTLEVSASGTFTVQVTDSNGCVNSDTVDVVLLEYDLPDLGEDVTTCASTLLEANAPANSYEWSTGEITESITVESSGIYWVKTISADLCQATDTINVTVHEVPEFELGANIEVCAGDTIQLAPSSNVEISSYSWSNGSTESQLDVFESGEYKVTATSVEGCVFTDSLTLIVNSLPVSPLIDSYEVCEQVTLDVGDVGDDYVWSTGSFTSEIEISNSGSYWVQITNSNDCSIIDTVDVDVSVSPILELGSDMTICEGESIQLDAQNTGSTYLWSTGELSQKITVTDSGEYAVEVSNGVCVESDTMSVFVQRLPVASFSFEGLCSGSVTSFDYTGTDSDLTYLWDFGDGSRSVNASPNKTFSNAGTYRVSLKVQNAVGCSATVEESVTILPRIQPNFAYSNVCSGEATTFSNGTVYSGNETLEYQWYFGDGNASTDSEPTHHYSDPGTYVVRLEVSAESCSNFITKTVEVKNSPVVDIGDSIATCSSSVVVNAGSSGTTYFWSDNSTGQTLDITTSGTYWVSVTSANGCLSADTLVVELYTYEVPVLGEDIEACGTHMLQANAAANSYRWSTGAITSNLNVTESGSYWVQTISEDLCINSDTVEVLIDPLPEFDLGADIELCEGESTVLVASSDVEVASYLWSDGSVDSAIEVDGDGLYEATLTSDEGCEFSDDVSVSINVLPESVLNASYLGCGSLTLQISSPGNAILWSTGERTPVIKITESGEYSVTLTTRSGCTTTDSTYVEIIELPTPNLGPDIELCDGEEVTLDAGVFSSYQWNGIAGGRYLVVGASGVYELSVTNEYGCVQTDEVEVYIRPSLGLNLADERLVCEGSEFLLDAIIDEEGYSYEWDSEAGVTGTERTLYTETPGLYWVTVTDTFGCSETEVINITTTTESIEASFLVPSVVSVGERVNFIQLTEPMPESFLWNLGNGVTTEELFNVSYRYQLPGTYTVSLTVSNGICEHTVSKEIEVKEGRTGDSGDSKVDYIDFQEVKVYPNPASTYVAIDFELTGPSTLDIQIYDLSGFRIAHHALDEENGQVQLDISSYASGTYMVIMRAGSKVRKMRFVKIR